jgi:DNA-binding NtrC family response regulator
MKNFRVLIVDDNAADLLAISALLQINLQPNVVLDTAPHAMGALACLSVRRYDLLICDVRMAKVDGLTLLKEAKCRWPKMPVILITAAGQDRKGEAIAAGAYAFLSKPIDIPELLRIIEQAIGQDDMRGRVLKANERG